MAQEVKVQLLDDLDLAEGREVDAERTVGFELDGTRYEIDLSRKNEEKLLKGMGPFVAAARPVHVPKGRSRPRANRARTAQIREWAQDRNIPIKDRGRIPAYIERQYNAAHS